MKKITFIIILLAQLILTDKLSAQLNFCPSTGEFCDSTLTLFFADSNLYITELELLFVGNDPRTGTYQAFEFGPGWAKFTVDASGEYYIGAKIYGQIICEYIPLEEHCVPSINCEDCPSEIINHVSGSICLVYDTPPPSAGTVNSVAFDFGEGDEKNGTYPVNYISLDTLEVVVPPSFCCDELTCDIYINGEQCSMSLNEFVSCIPPPPINPEDDPCSCAGKIGDCSETIIDYLGARFMDKRCSMWEGSCDIYGNIYRQGIVSIGSERPPADIVMLNILGGVLSEKITVELCATDGWCDYVFAPDYQLMSLPDLSRYIQNNKHLPGIPSTEEIKEQGFLEMKNIKTLQQEKIEEVFLHVVALSKRLEQLKTEAALLKLENQQMKVRSTF